MIVDATGFEDYEEELSLLAQEVIDMSKTPCEVSTDRASWIAEELRDILAHAVGWPGRGVCGKLAAESRKELDAAVDAVMLRMNEIPDRVRKDTQCVQATYNTLNQEVDAAEAEIKLVDSTPGRLCEARRKTIDAHIGRLRDTVEAQAEACGVSVGSQTRARAAAAQKEREIALIMNADALRAQDEVRKHIARELRGLPEDWYVAYVSNIVDGIEWAAILPSDRAAQINKALVELKRRILQGVIARLERRELRFEDVYARAAVLLPAELLYNLVEVRPRDVAVIHNGLEDRWLGDVTEEIDDPARVWAAATLFMSTRALRAAAVTLGLAMPTNLTMAPADGNDLGWLAYRAEFLRLAAEKDYMRRSAVVQPLSESAPSIVPNAPAVPSQSPPQASRPRKVPSVPSAMADVVPSAMADVVKSKAGREGTVASIMPPQRSLAEELAAAQSSIFRVTKRPLPAAAAASAVKRLRFVDVDPLRTGGESYSCAYCATNAESVNAVTNDYLNSLNNDELSRFSVAIAATGSACNVCGSQCATSGNVAQDVCKAAKETGFTWERAYKSARELLVARRRQQHLSRTPTSPSPSSPPATKKPHSGFCGVL